LRDEEIAVRFYCQQIAMRQVMPACLMRNSILFVFSFSIPIISWHGLTLRTIRNSFLHKIIAADKSRYACLPAAYSCTIRMGVLVLSSVRLAILPRVHVPDR
jgi:hypothetical protein